MAMSNMIRPYASSVVIYNLLVPANVSKPPAQRVFTATALRWGAPVVGEAVLYDALFSFIPVELNQISIHLRPTLLLKIIFYFCMHASY